MSAVEEPFVTRLSSFSRLFGLSRLSGLFGLSRPSGHEKDQKDPAPERPSQVSALRSQHSALDPQSSALSTHVSLLTPYPLPLTDQSPLLPVRLKAYDADMRIQLSHPARTVDLKGPKRAKDVLRELNLLVEAHLVIRGDELVTEDELLSDSDQIEIRPVISGG